MEVLPPPAVAVELERRSEMYPFLALCAVGYTQCRENQINKIQCLGNNGRHQEGTIEKLVIIGNTSKGNSNSRCKLHITTLISVF